MKKRLLVLSAMLLCVVMMFSSCALFTPKIKFENFIQPGYAPETGPTLNQLNKLNIKGFNRTSDSYIDGDYYSSSDLAVLVDTNATTGLNTTVVYNIATNETLLTRTDTKSESGSSIVNVRYTIGLRNLNFYEVDETVTLVFVSKLTVTSTATSTDSVYETTVLTDKGMELVSLSNVNRIEVNEGVWMAADLFCVWGKVYRVSEDGSVNFAFEWSDLKDKPSNLQKAGEYYVARDSNVLNIYDGNLNVKISYAIPTYGYEDDDLGSFGQAHVLSNGNVLVQYMVRQDPLAKKYTLIMNGEKYNLYSVLVQAEKGKTKKLNLDYIIQHVEFGNNIEGINKKVENVAVAYPVEDKHVDMNPAALKLVSMTNVGKIAGIVEKPVVEAFIGEGFWAIARNRWVIGTTDDRELVLNEKGEVVGEISNVDHYTDSVLVANKKVYDFDLNLLVDLQNYNATDIQTFNNGVLFRTNKNEVKIYINNEVKTLISESEAKDGNRTFTKLSSGLYMITETNSNNKVKYEIYNESGTRLGTITDNVYGVSVVRVAQDGAVLLSAQTVEDNVTKYYSVN